MVEQLIRNQQVVGSSPIFSSKALVLKAGAFIVHFSINRRICQETANNYLFVDLKRKM